MVRIGLISDTHGLLRPQARDFLAGSQHILHAGDIGGAEILEQLAGIAPLTAVRGNNDHGPWAERLRATELVALAGVRILLLHDKADLEPGVLEQGVQVVVTGHSHQPRVDRHGGVLFVNPGSAGPRRFKLPIAAGELLVDGGAVSARIVEL